jgi:hypothetical protein
VALSCQKSRKPPTPKRGGTMDLRFCFHHRAKPVGGRSTRLEVELLLVVMGRVAEVGEKKERLLVK